MENPPESSLREEVLNKFILPYYDVVKESPERLFDFYFIENRHPDSCLIDDITQRMMLLGHADIELLNVDPKSMFVGRVGVVVTGRITRKDRSPQSFKQVFLLALLEKDDDYYVLTDTLHLTRSADYSERYVTPAVDVGPSVIHTVPESDVSERAESKVKKLLKKSDASVVLDSKQKAVSVPTPAPADEIRFSFEGFPVYIRGLPRGVTVAMVEKEFQRFGPIKPNSVQIRNEVFGLGFLEFEDHNSLKNAIMGSPVTINGRRPVVEEAKICRAPLTQTQATPATNDEPSTSTFFSRSAPSEKKFKKRGKLPFNPKERG
uniref:nuclear transport factor 2-like n=1 Tax=Erigeron canadensis TaxID=72917 RepID=UPI001CB8ED09|nr:nuclear transport factor 2-like [Erigeron canadensis]XP_043631002.1 nuclear transport factor 2-like [Erigeron canadensis]